MAGRRNRRVSSSRGEPLPPLAPLRVEQADPVLRWEESRREPLPARPRPALDQVQDRRLWHPEKPGMPLRGTRTVTGGPARLSLVQQARIRKIARQTALDPRVVALLAPPPARVVFREPNKTVVCVRRAIRRQVLAAAGKFGVPMRRPKWSGDSFISCVRKRRR